MGGHWSRWRPRPIAWTCRSDTGLGVSFSDPCLLLMASPPLVWQEIGTALKEAAAQLRSGELLHGPGFSLFDAMSAVELLDPRMDAGMTPAADADAPAARPTVSSPLSSTRPGCGLTRAQAPAVLSAAEAIDVLDGLMACEASWHQGHSLAQTVYTCLYLHLPAAQLGACDPVIVANVKAVCAASASAISVVGRAEMHAEEDFVTHCIGLPTGDGGTAAAGRAALAALSLVAEGISRRLAALESAASSPTQPVIQSVTESLTQSVTESPGEVAPRVGNGDGSGAHDAADGATAPQLRALLCRTRLRRHMLSVLLSLERQGQWTRDASPGKYASLGRTASAARAELAAVADTLCLADGWDRGEGAEAASAPGDAVGVAATSSAKAPAVAAAAMAAQARATAAVGAPAARIGFEPGVNRAAMAPALPRPVALLTRRAAVAHLSSFLTQIESLAVHLPTVTTLRELLIATASLNSGPPPGPSAIARAALAIAVRDGGAVAGGAPLAHLVAAAMPLPPAMGRTRPESASAAATIAAGLSGLGLSNQGLESVTPNPSGDAAPPDAPDAWPLPQAVVGRLMAEPTTASFVAEARATTLLLLQRTLCAHAARRQRNLRKVLPDWAALCVAASEADPWCAAQLLDCLGGTHALATVPPQARAVLERWAPRPLSTWAEGQAARWAAGHLMDGFPLELYAPHEAGVVYWYLEYLLGQRWIALRHAHDGLTAFAAIRAHRPPPLPPRSKGARPRAAAAAEAASAADAESVASAPHIAALAADAAGVQAQQQLSKGAARLLAGLASVGRLHPPPQAFGTPAERFDQRFGALRALPRPAPLAYEARGIRTRLFVEFEAGGAGRPVLWFDAAAEAFLGARASIAQALAVAPPAGDAAAGPWRELPADELRAMDRVAATNLIAAKLMARGGDAAAALAVSLDYSAHRVWAAVVLRSK